MHKTVVIDIVGLSKSVITDNTPFLKKYISEHHIESIAPMLPAVTTSVQSTYVTGQRPASHGIVGNGWYDREDAEVKFWKQSNALVHGEKIWDRAKREDPSFTCSKMFWWYNMYSTADYSVTPRPNYLADGRKMPDCYSHPASLRDELQAELGVFPLFKFWGPGADIESTRWIADATLYTDKKYDPTLTLVYLPHLDYCLQKFGPNHPEAARHLREVDEVVEEMVKHYQARDARIILLSEYGIAPVDRVIHINRLLREHGWLGIRTERGLELLDAGASRAFAVADHQVAHVYINDASIANEVKKVCETTSGIKLVLDRQQQREYHIDNARTGDLLLMADQQSWFSYYFWIDDAVAPDYARVVDIHKKPGYDPVELFMSSKARAGYKLLRKKAGLRYVMDVIPLDASLIKGSHGSIAVEEAYHPVLITDKPTGKASLVAKDVYDVIWQHLV